MVGNVGSIILFCLLSVQTACAAPVHAWARLIRGITSTFHPFELELVTEESGRLVATANYMDYRSPDLSRAPRLPATIDGIRTSDGRFWPEVKAEVSDDINNNWKPIDTQARPGHRIKMTFQENSPNEWLHVDLEPFRQMIGKIKYGRVVLKNGETDIFALKNLLPPSAPPGYWSESMLSGADLFATPPFVVLAFLSQTGMDVLASCGYVNKDNTSPINLKGTRTPGGVCGPPETGSVEFWPSITAQLAIDYDGPWKTIDPPALPGEPSTISIGPGRTPANLRLCVKLNNFRPFIGKFRYGRVVLPNGKAAIFELRDLLPPEKAALERPDSGQISRP